ncbi:hypothetical protein [Maribacter sp. 2-571]|uniref:hypothetical protein n=1 Tax=Maribacter sp. 2-571 TaxID=3417569 RepID=UPI003D34E11D
MELNFDYTTLAETLQEHLPILKRIAYFGILALMVPIIPFGRSAKTSTQRKAPYLAYLFILSTWIMGAVAMAIMTALDQPTIKLFLVWIIIFLSNLFFILLNGRRIYKFFQRLNHQLQEDKG